MPLLLEQLLVDAQLDLDYKMESADLPSTNDNMGAVVKIKGLGEQRISMNTDAYQRKLGAFAVIFKVSENMGAAFAPYVEPILPIITAHMPFEYNKAIRKFALKTFKNLLIAMGEPTNVQYLQQSLPMYIEQLNKNLYSKNQRVVKMLLKSFANNLKAVGRTNQQNREFLNQEQINSLGPIMTGTLELVTELKSAHQQVLSMSKATYDLDDEDLARCQEEIDNICRAATQVMEVSGQLCEKFGDRALSVCDSSAKAYFAAKL